MIDIETGRYEMVKGSGDDPEPRVGHIAGVVDGTIYVFGGVSEKSSETVEWQD